MKFLKIFWSLLFILKLAGGANILAVLSVKSYSHILVQMHVMKELLRNGHEVTLLSPEMIEFGHENFTFYHLEEKVELNASIMMQFKTKSRLSAVKEGFYYAYNALNDQLKNEHFQHFANNLNNEKFDLLFLDPISCVHCILAEVYDCPIILSSTDVPHIYKHELIGNYIHFSTQSDVHIYPAIHGKLTFIDRLVHFYPIGEMLKAFIQSLTTMLYDNLISSSFPNLKFESYQKILEKRLKTAFSFTTSMTSNVNPEVPIYHHIGSIHMEPPKELDDELEFTKFLDKSSNGVIMMSFGSAANELSEEVFTKFVNTFKDLPYNILWKSNLEKYRHMEIPKNILIQKWLPFSDVLGHKNVKLLITHGGLRTIEEAIDREIPMILFPLTFDQPFNALLMDSHKIGISMDLNDFTQESLNAAIHEMMKYEYKGNVRKIKEFISDRMSTSLETAVENIEYLLKHNETFEYLSYPGRDVSGFVKYFCDIHLILIAFFIALKIVVKFCFNLLRR